jgi:hypothetical protein
MHWSNVTRQPSDQTLRQFAACCLGGSLAAAWLLWRGSYLSGGSLLLTCLGLGFAGLAVPRLLRWPYLAAMLFTFPIGWTVSHVILAVIYFGLMTPIGWSRRLFGRRTLEMKFDASQNSYWTPREKLPEPKSYLRQY